MLRKLTIKGISFNQGPPKICVSLCVASEQQLCERVKHYIKHGGFDILEWRIDYLYDLSITYILSCAALLRKLCPELLLIATFRTKQEGGQQSISVEDYFSINCALIESQLIDIIDLELFIDKIKVSQCIKYAHQNNLHIIVSNHNFSFTFSENDIIERLREMQEMGADLAKIAVMPLNAADVLTLLSATYKMNEHYANRPIITIAMGALGVITRLSGELFGSAMTFGCIDNVSAPGQIHVDELEKFLNVLHKTC